jgi:hypothetical protein
VKRIGDTRDRLALTWIDGALASTRTASLTNSTAGILKQRLECRGQGLQQMMG